MASTDTLRDRWIDWVLGHHRLILVVALVLTALAAVMASRLKVDSDLRRLLPEDDPVVRNLEKIERTFGSTGSVNVVVRGKSAQARHAFTRALAEEVSGHPLLRDVDYRLPSDFFTEHALYYLSDEEIEELDERIQAWIHYEFCSESPQSCVTEPDPEALDRLESFVEDKRQEAHERTGFDDFYEREGIDANVLLLHPTEPAADLGFAREISNQMRAAAREVYERPDQAWSDGAVTYNVVGPYINKADEQAIVKRDTIRAGLAAVTGVLLVLYLLFRSGRAVLVLVVPLGCGVVWSLAATWLVIGDLNLMTSMISTVVMGAGIDAGIHFLVRARRERRRHETEQAIRIAFRTLIVPLLVASSTTIGAFAIMAVSDFPAFREFGIIAAMGVALCLCAMITVLPSLTLLVGLKRSKRKPPKTEGLLSRVLLARPGILLGALAVLTVLATLGAQNVQFEYDGRALQSDHSREIAGTDIRLISDIFGRDIHAGLLVRPTLQDARATVEQARDRRAARTEPSVVAELFAVSDLLPEPTIDLQERQEAIEDLLEEDELEELEEIAGVESELRKRKQAEDRGDDWDEDFGDEDGDGQDGGEEEDWDDEPSDQDGEGLPSDAAPAEGTEAPSAQPADDEPTKDGGDEKKLTPEDAATLIAMLDAAPFTIEDLPPVLLRKVRSNGRYGVFAYPAFDAANMKKGVEFTRETSSYLDEEDRAETMFVGETTVYAAMFVMLREEAPFVLGLAALLIAILVFWQLRSLRQAMMTLLPLVVALWWLVGLMGAIDLRFTLFNLPILPAILGIGVDNGVYLTDRIRRSKGEVDGLLRSLQETGSAIMAAMATTAIGFAAFMVADSAGVRGIGAVAVLGIVLAGLAATLLLPAMVGFAQRVRQR